MLLGPSGDVGNNYKDVKVTKTGLIDYFNLISSCLRVTVVI